MSPEYGERRHDPARLNRSADQWTSRIVEGISRAYDAKTEVSPETARLIAHVLGRALGRDSQLAEFARTGEGSYDGLRDEYLTLYTDPTTPPMVKEWIDWLGTHLVQSSTEGSGRRFMNEHLAPRLPQLLLRDQLTIGDEQVVVHFPADLSGPDIQDLADRLKLLEVLSDDGLRAFLTLKDVDANADNLMEAFAENYVGFFDTIDDALRGLTSLSEWQSDLEAFGRERGIGPALSIDLDVIENLTREIYDLVELGGRIHAFHK